LTAKGPCPIYLIDPHLSASGFWCVQDLGGLLLGDVLAGAMADVLVAVQVCVRLGVLRSVLLLRFQVVNTGAATAALHTHCTA
jgi:hypothetical protein